MENQGEHHQLEHKAIFALDSFEKYVFKPKFKKEGGGIDENFCEELRKWATQHEVDHISFICFPYNETICRKEDSLLELKVKGSDHGVKRKAELVLNREILLKSETDGSSFPSGGLQGTHHARAYTVRDPLSDIFIKKKDDLLCIPSLLVTHNGDALDDKTIFRKSEAVMKSTATRLLNALGKKPKQILLNLGLEQEFFLIPKAAYLQRPDLLFCGRALVGKVGAKHQQFADHYFSKIPHQIIKIFEELEQQLLEIGIPFKTKHNEVAINQFELSAIFCEAGKAIDQNLMAMEIIREVFDKNGYAALLHEKPFIQINGSGKHANWSLGYVDDDGKVKNLFSVPSKEEDKLLFQLFVLITLTALKKHNSLYFGSVAPPGNEVRLGGHEAPPRIISAFLGEAVNAIIDEVPLKPRKNLRTVLPFLEDDVYQEDSDRNRTSAFPYTGHKFEFRALGSSQNPAWPMAIICATLAKEMMVVEEKLKKGVSLKEIINELREESKTVRYDGNGYAEEWKQQALKRGLYVNESFSELYNRIDEDVKVFVEIGACNKEEIAARCQVMRDVYMLTVESEAKALMNLAKQKIFPRAMNYLKVLENGHADKKFVKAYVNRFNDTLNLAMEQIEELKAIMDKCGNVDEAGVLRAKVISVGESMGDICSILPKDHSFPDLEDFLLL